MRPIYSGAMIEACRIGRRLAAFVVCVAMLGAVSIRAAQDDPPVGIFVGTPDGPQEVGVYAIRTSSGRLSFEAGSLDDVPMVQGLVRVICNMPLWRLRSVWLSTARAVDDDRAKRRTLPVRMRRLSISAMFVQVRATEQPATLEAQLRAVGAGPDDPAYLFFTLESGGRTRDYIIGIAPPD